MASPNSTKLMRSGNLWQTRSRSPSHNENALAEASIRRDLDDEPSLGDEHPVDDDSISDSDSDPDLESLRQSMTNTTATSLMGAGPRAAIATGLRVPSGLAPKYQRREARRQKRCLLRDNNVLPPQPTRASHNSETIVRNANPLLAIPDQPGGCRTNMCSQDSAEDRPLLETSPLLNDPDLPYGGQINSKTIDQKWEEAVLEGRIQTTWQQEANVLSRYSGPLILTFLLQYSLTVASIFTVGQLGKVELAATSLASMTANITGYAIYQGLATSLDTLCAQAYGSGRKKLVGLQTQRMVYFLCAITFLIAGIWLSAELILTFIVPEKDVAILAGQYLRVILVGAPGYAIFESAKRYTQAQGLFSVSLRVLLICAPLNAFMNWLFVWHFRWGFIGAPIAVAITDNLLPGLMILYIYYFTGTDCWPGLTKRAFKNWGPMIKLALPGLLMVEAEILAFEVLTLAAARFGTAHLAAQSILSTLIGLTFQIPFPISIAASTRIANLIGATLSDAARVSAKVAGLAAAAVGALNMVLLLSLKSFIPQLFTSDPQVISLVAETLPLCAAFQLFDAVAACCNGILRGLGRQEIGGYVQIFAYYMVAMPISFGSAFGLGWGLQGLWMGVAVALGLVAGIEAVFLAKSNWNHSVEKAKARNEQA